MLPGPLVANTSSPGRALHSATSSFTFFTGIAFGTTRMFAALVICETGTKSLLRVVVHFLQQRVRDDRTEIAEQERVTVGRLLRGVIHADRARGARPRIDDHLLPPHLGERRADDARHRVGASPAG